MVMTKQAKVCRGVAAMELVGVLPLILILILGIWDVGRMVEVQQLLSNATREGARQAAVGITLDGSTGAERDIYTTDVQQTVLNYLARNGIDTTGANILFMDLDNPSATDPYQAAHLNHLRVSVQLPFQNVRWLLFGTFISGQVTDLSSSSDWVSMKDVDVSVSTALPTN